ncbi:MAG TPA: hypothetical protein VNO70_21675 [Blastocatellia bacterium]|nr:hypothetical protein [Blastocatellia bacterium]
MVSRKGRHHISLEEAAGNSRVREGVVSITSPNEERRRRGTPAIRCRPFGPLCSGRADSTPLRTWLLPTGPAGLLGSCLLLMNRST